MDFPGVKQGASLPVELYAMESDIPIYSRHIHNTLEQCMRSVFHISPQAIHSRDRSATVAAARQTAMYLANVSFGLTFSEIGRLFSRDRTTVSYACGVVEDRRDDPTVDYALLALEAALIRLTPGTPCPTARNSIPATDH